MSQSDPQEVSPLSATMVMLIKSIFFLKQVACTDTNLLALSLISRSTMIFVSLPLLKEIFEP